jgi:hypothetical protein
MLCIRNRKYGGGMELKLNGVCRVTTLIGREMS